MLAQLNRWPVRPLVLSGLALVAVVVTLLAWLASVIVDLAAGWVSGGELATVAGTAARMPVPDWLALLIDPAWVKALQSLAQELLRVGGDVLPMLGQGIGLLNWLIWGSWGLVMLGLGVAALKVHWLVGDSQRALTRHSAPSARSVNR